MVLPLQCYSNGRKITPLVASNLRCLLYVISVIMISYYICTRVYLYTNSKCIDGAATWMCQCILVATAFTLCYWLGLHYMCSAYITWIYQCYR